MSRQVSVLRVAGHFLAAHSKQADNIYEGLPLEEMGARVELEIQKLKDEAFALGKLIRLSERAWENLDMDALFEAGILSERDMKHLRDAFEAQQAGDGQSMDHHLDQVLALRYSR
jgi:hypothetical protein